MSKLISIPTLCKLYGKDSSQMRKMIDELEIPKQKVRRTVDNRIVTAIEDSDHQKLVDHFANLTAKKASDNHITMSQAMIDLGFKKDQHSNFKRTCEQYGIALKKLKVNNRTQYCLTKSGFKKLKKIRESITIQDVD